jgi:hypothetical protein
MLLAEHGITNGRSTPKGPIAGCGPTDAGSTPRGGRFIKQLPNVGNESIWTLRPAADEPARRCPFPNERTDVECRAGAQWPHAGSTTYCSGPPLCQRARLSQNICIERRSRPLEGTAVLALRHRSR